MVKIIKISARNPIRGIVKMIKKEPVSTEVVVLIPGGNEIAPSIVAYSAEKMDLREG